MQVFKVEQWMNRNVITLTRDRPVVDAAELMRKHNIGCIIVVENEKPIGIVSERDIIRKIVARRRSPDETPVEDIMSMSIISVETGTDIKDVSTRMVQFNIKKIPVVDDNRLQGIITTSDIIKILSKLNKLYDAKDIIELGA